MRNDTRLLLFVRTLAIAALLLGLGAATVLLWSAEGFAQMLGETDHNVSNMTGDEHECAIAKNPADITQLFMACNREETPGNIAPGLFVARSTDAGKTWMGSILADGTDPLIPAASADPSLAWDGFGNLYFGYLSYDYMSFVILRSTNGGQNFTLLQQFQTSSPLRMDRPTVVAANTATATAGAPAWLAATWHEKLDTGSYVMRTSVWQVTPTGAVGTFVGPLNIPGTNNCMAGDIAIAPKGAVVAACQTSGAAEGPVEIKVSRNLDPFGLDPGLSDAFSNAAVVTTTNVGPADTLPAVGNYIVDAAVGLAYDSNGPPDESPHFGRLYMVYADEVGNETNDTDIMLRYSDNDGETWTPSSPNANAGIRVNDVSNKSQFLPRIASDPLSGNIAICWHDARDSAANNSARVYCRIATPGASPATPPNWLGNSWPVADAASTATGGGGGFPDIKFGDYAGLTYFQGVLHPAWADHRGGTGHFDAYTDRVRLAPPLCIARAVGVPGGLGGPPNWWDSPMPTGFDASDPQFDPRWNAARTVDYGTGSNSQVEFRSLFQTQGSMKFLYLSWYVKVQPGDISSNNTSVYFGLAPETTTGKGTVLRFILHEPATGNPPQPQPSTVGSTTYFSVSMQQRSSASGSWTMQNPAWLQSEVIDKTRMWAGGSPPYWAFNARIPIDPSGANGIEVDDTFRMWYYVQPTLPAAGPTGVIPYTWPRTDPANVTAYVAQDGPIYPEPTDWGLARTLHPLPSSCLNNGVALFASDIGTTGSTSSKIEWNVSSTFFAKPKNYSTIGINPGILKATFRMANWGSHTGDLTSASWQVIPDLADVPDAGGITAGTDTTPASGNIQDNTLPSAWPQSVRCAFQGQSGVPSDGIPGDASCPNVNPTHQTHQCVLVTLTGPGIDFIHFSARRNMDFVGASRFVRDAVIDTRGLPANADPDRDVYLYLERRNMPGFPAFSWNPGQRLYSARKEVSRVNLKEDENPRADLPNDFDRLAADAPTYVVHAYQDTGKTVRIAETDHPIFQPLSSFGYFVRHDGPLFGWSPALKGAEQVAPNLYKLAIARDGVATVTTQIDAIDLTTWWIWLIILLLILVIYLVRRVTATP